MTAAVLKLSLSVALAGICAALLWTLLKNALTLTTAGLVTAPSFSATEPTFAALATAALTFTLLGPIAEELFFRDALFRKLRLRWSPVKVALALSLLFGLGHSDPPASGLFGLAMLVLYTKTRVVWAPIIGHVANNLVPFTLDNLIRVLPRSALEAMVGRPAKFVTLVPAVLGTLWLLRFLRDNWHTLGDPLHGVRSETGREPTPGSQTDGAAG
jgi:membrane protease YdiL (CAAX protease family)